MKRLALPFMVCGLAAILVVIGAVFLLRGERGPSLAGPDAQPPSVLDASTATRAAPPAPVLESPAANDRVPLADAAAESVSTGDAALQVAIAAADGAAIAGAQTVLFREQEVLELAVSDAQGRASFKQRSGAGEIAVFAPGYPMLRQPMALEAGLHRLTLPEGDSLSGWVDVDGSPPRESIALLWVADYQPRAAFDQLPASVRERLRGLSAGNGCPVATTDAQGGFAFHGLQLGASGRLVWDGPYWAVDESKDIDRQELRLPAPRRDVKLHLFEGLELRLRVVDSAGAPVPRARVGLTSVYKREAGNEQSEIGRAADDRGLCRFSLPRKLPNLLRATVAFSDGGGTTAHDLRLPAATRGVWDVGDLAVQPTRALTVRVEDSEGHPVEGASVTPQPSVTGNDRSSTDSDGRCRLALALDVHKLSVIAAGYDFAQVSIPSKVEELVVVLESRCQIEFAISGFEGPPRDLGVVIRGDPPLFTGKSQKGEAEQNRASFSVREQGRCLVSGLTPNNPLSAELRYRSGHVLAVAQIAPLARGEHRRVELAITAQPLKLRVLVQDEQGNPIPNAKVALKYPGIGNPGEPVDAGGRLELGPIYGQPFTLVAHAPEFAPKALYGVTIPPAEITLVLEKPRRVEIELHDRDGSLFRGKADVIAGTGGPDSVGVSQGNGRWILDGLPRGEISLYAWGEFGDVHELHDTSNPKRVLTVGEPGSLKVNATSSGGHGRQEWAVALADHGSSQARMRVRFFFDDNGRKESEFTGLAMGSYDVWLETRGSLPDGAWSRIGSSANASLDLEHPKAKLELRN